VQAIQDSEDFPSPIGLAQGQTARLTVMNIGDEQGFVNWKFLDAFGRTLAETPEPHLIPPGQFRSFDFDLPNPPPGIADVFGRAQVRVIVRTVGNPDIKILRASVEVFDNATGRRALSYACRPRNTRVRISRGALPAKVPWYAMSLTILSVRVLRRATLFIQDANLERGRNIMKRIRNSLVAFVGLCTAMLTLISISTRSAGSAASLSCPDYPDTVFLGDSPGAASPGWTDNVQAWLTTLRTGSSRRQSDPFLIKFPVGFNLNTEFDPEDPTHGRPARWPFPMPASLALMDTRK
jgi:hypothetical protein